MRRIYPGHEKEALIGLAIFFVIAVVIKAIETWRESWLVYGGLIGESPLEVIYKGIEAVIRGDRVYTDYTEGLYWTIFYWVELNERE